MSCSFEGIAGKVGSFSIGHDAVYSPKKVEDSMIAGNGARALRVAVLCMTLLTEPIFPSERGFEVVTVCQISPVEPNRRDFALTTMLAAVRN